MKKLLIYLMSFIGLFVLAFGVYNSFTSETDSELVAESIAMVAEEEATESLAEISETEEVVESDESEEPEEPEELEEPVEAVVATEADLTSEWQGPVTSYLDEEGEEHFLNDSDGKPTILNIWATWCPPCRDEMPLFDENYALYGDEVNFIMLNALDSRPTETKEAALSFVDEMGLSFPIYFDVDFNNQVEFVANMLPLTVLMDHNGEVVEVVRGQVSPAKLKQLLGKVIEVS